MADEENDKESKDNVELIGGKSFDNSKLQQIKSENDILQTDEAIDSQNLMYQNEKQSKEHLLKNQNMLEKEPINRDIQLGFPFTDRAETTSMQIDSILGNQIQQENNLYSQQTFITPNSEACYETESQQQVSLEFENNTNQILRQKLIQPLTELGNIASKTIKDQTVDDFVLSKTTDDSQDQQSINNEFMDISETLENSRREMQIEKQLDFGILHDEETSDDTMNKNLRTWDSGHQLEKYEATCDVFDEENTEHQNQDNELTLNTNSNMIYENAQNFTVNTIIIGLQSVDGKLLEVINSLSIIANDSKRELHLPKIEYQELEKTKTLDKALHLMIESSEESEEMPHAAEFSEAAALSERSTATEIHAKAEYSMPEILVGDEKLKADAIHLTMIDETNNSIEESSLEQDKLEATCNRAKYSKDLSFSKTEDRFTTEDNETNHIKESTESLISRCDSENVNQNVLKRGNIGKEFESIGDEEGSDKFLLNLKSAKVGENENVNQIRDEYQESLRSEELQEQVLYEEQGNPINVRNVENIITPRKFSKEILEERKNIFEANENKGISKIDNKSDNISGISDQRYEMDKHEGNENIIAYNDNKFVMKSSESLNTRENKNIEKDTKSKHLSEKGKNISSTMLTKSTVKTTKKISPTTNAKIMPKSKNIKKINQAVIDQKSITKPLVSITPISTKTTILKEKNTKESELKHPKNVSNAKNVTALKRTTMPLKTSTETLKTTQKKLQESRNFAKSESNSDSKIDLKNKAKNIVKEHQKIEKDTKNDKNGLARREKKIGIIDLEPLIWMETLMPTYEQIWKFCEPINQITDKTDIEKTTDKKLEIDEKIENLEINNSELIQELKKNSELMKVEITKFIILSDKDEVNLSECLTASNKDKEILSLFDSSKVREEKRKKLAVEEEIIMANNNKIIEISGLIPSKPCEAVETSLKVQSDTCFKQKIFDTITEEDIMIDMNKYSDSFHENIEGDIVSSSKLNASGDSINIHENTEEDTIPLLKPNASEILVEDSANSHDTSETQDEDSHKNVEESSLKLNTYKTQSEDSVNSCEKIREDTIPLLKPNASEILVEDSANSHDTSETQDEDSHKNVEESSLKLNTYKTQSEYSVNSCEKIREDTVPLLKTNASEIQIEDSTNSHDASETQDEDSHKNVEESSLKLNICKTQSEYSVNSCEKIREDTVPLLKTNASEIQIEDSTNSHENIKDTISSFKLNALETDKDSHKNREESPLKPDESERQNDNLVISHENKEEDAVPPLKQNASEIQNEDSTNAHQNIGESVPSLKLNASETQDEDSINSHKNIDENTVPLLKLNVSETEINTAVRTDKTITVENGDKLEGKNRNNEEMTLSEKEKPEIKFERNDNDKIELRMIDEMITSKEMKTEKKIAVLAGSDSVQQLQSESGINDSPRYGQEKLRTNDNLRHNKYHQQKGPFGGMYSDILEEYKYNNAGKDSLSHKYQPQHEYNRTSGNVELQGSHQQQSSGNQNHARKQKQQHDDTNKGYNPNYSGQQGHKKRHKRNKKPRNW